MSARNLIQLFETTAQEYPNDACFRSKLNGTWRDTTWQQLKDKVRSLSANLEARGVVQGERVAILSSTREEWTLSDLAILSLGAITIPIYQSNLAHEVEYILNHSEAKGIIVENPAQLKKVMAIKGQVPQLEFIIMMQEGRSDHTVELLEDCLKTDPNLAKSYERMREELGPESLASYVYTSGTTGKPKGAMLTHGNFIAEVVAVKKTISIQHDYVMLSFLPLAHILARAVQFYHLGSGFTTAFAESIEHLGDNLQEVRPHFIVSVPRIFEKVYERIISQVHSASPTKQKLFAWAKEVGTEYSRAKQSGEPPSVAVSLQYFLASRLVFSKIRERLGGRMIFAVCGGAPLAREIAEFFHAAGIAILEGYGLTETTAAINCVQPDKIEFGVVGPPAEGTEEKIADDGEILARGPLIFKGYYKDEAATREALSEDGWFKTGDIGEFTESGSLKITDRKKDIIVTAGGKNIAPQKIENLLKLNKFISQVVIHGDKRKFLTALISLSPEELTKFARAEGITQNGAKLTQNKKILNLVKEIVDETNQQLPSYETIKRFAILDRELTQDHGEVTPSLKIKRRFVVKKFEDTFNRLYEEPAK